MRNRLIRNEAIGILARDCGPEGSNNLRPASTPIPRASVRPRPERDQPRNSACVVSEILFVDCSVPDLVTIRANLRREVQAIVLDNGTSAARQIASAIDGHEGLAAVHIMAHGAPGQVIFAAGDWSKETINHEDFSAIGKALRHDGRLLLWSCHVGEGPRGRNFVDALSRATGAAVAAASDRIGSPSRGGNWQLKVRKFPDEPAAPLTAAGMAGYAGLLADNYLSVAFPVGTQPNKYFIVANLRGVQTVIGDFTVPKSPFAGSLAVMVSAHGSFDVAGSGDMMAAAQSIGLFTQSNPTSDIAYDTETTSILGPAGTTVSCSARRAFGR